MENIKPFNNNKFSNWLFFERLRYKLSMRDAAKEIGVNVSTLSRFEKKKFLPDVNTYYLCCKWMKVSVEEFFRTEKNE